MGTTNSLLSTIAPLATAAPYHLLAYGTLLGTELYQSFVMTKICYQVLPMSAFTNLQKRVFPSYFRIQTLLFLLTAVTYPPYGPYSLIKNSTGDTITLVFAVAMALLNLTVYGPRTQEAMIVRIHQETRDGKKSNNPEMSEAMRVKNRAFSHNHAMSIHLNMLAMGATLWYGLRLASRIQV